MAVSETSRKYIELQVRVPDQYDPRSYVAGSLSMPTLRSWPSVSSAYADTAFALVVQHGAAVYEFSTWAEAYDWLTES